MTDDRLDLDLDPALGGRLPAALLVLRLTLASFLFAWASLKFTRPEWAVNVWTNNYGQDRVTPEHAYFIGGAQMLVALAFASGSFRTPVYGGVALMHATGLLSAMPQLLDPATYPKNLLWTSVPTLGGFVALFVLREWDAWANVTAAVRHRRRRTARSPRRL